MIRMTVFPAHPTISGRAIQDFQTRFAGRLVFTNHPDYDALCAAWEGADEHPAIIAIPYAIPDIAAVVQFARAHDLSIAVRGSDWNPTDNPIAEGCLVIDLSAMKDVRMDTHTWTVRAQAGATWDELQQAVQPFSLSQNDLTTIDIVTWDGRWLTLSEREHVHLYWGAMEGHNVGIIAGFVSPLHVDTWELPADEWAYPSPVLEAIFGY